MENLKINITSENSDVVVRTGEAIELKPDNGVKLFGTIKAPMDYYELRSKVDDWDDQKAVVTVNRNDGIIMLQYDLANPYTTDVVTGQLKFNPDLQKFGINSQKVYNQKDLVALIKSTKHLFSDNKAAFALIAALSNFTAKVETSIESISRSTDAKGQAKQLHDSIAKISVPLEFSLLMPIFIGEKSEVFKVDVGYEPIGSSVQFYLESDQLMFATEALRDKVFEAELVRVPASVFKIYV